MPRRNVAYGLGVVAIALLGFLGGQVAPKYVPATWTVGHSNLNFNDLNSMYDLLQEKYDGKVDPGKVMDGARAGVISSAGDPYTVYLDAKSAKELDDQLKGQLSGVGAEIAIRNNKLTVVSPISGSPVEKAGVKAGDYIAAIDDKSSSNYTLDEAVARIRGKKGTKVKLTIVRGSNSPQDITITRDQITVPSVTWSMKDGNIGYINISEFGADTSDKVSKAAQDLKAKGVSKLVLDLRNNPGGYVDAAQAVVSQFMTDGKVVMDERHNGKSVQKLYTRDGGTLAGMPVVVLINGGSASASEITAGALRDDIGAKLIGEKSFGKGSMQEITQLNDGAEVKITVAHWFTPSGQGIDKKGIAPTIEVKQTQADFDAGRDPQLDRALQELNK